MNQETEIAILKQLNKMKRGGEYIALSLYPPLADTIIREEGNRMFINEGRKGKFEDVSEKFYDLMVKRFDSRG